MEYEHERQTITQTFLSFLHENQQNQPEHLKDKPELISVLKKAGREWTSTKRWQFFIINNNQLLHVTYHVSNILGMEKSYTTYELKTKLSDEDVTEHLEKELNIKIRLKRIV